MKIIYYYSQMNVGGAERSTIRLLNKFCENNHDVTILLRWDCGTLENLLDPRIKKIYLKRKHQGGGKIGYIWNFCVETILSYFREFTLSKGNYDICINGLLGYNPRILFKRIKAKQYYQMLRCDVKESAGYGKTSEYMKKYGKRFDAYIGVSQYTTESFSKVYPDLAERAYTIYNILEEKIQSENFNPFVEYENKFKILTVCRLSDKAKGLVRMVEVCAELSKKYGDSFVWFVVGDGPDREMMRGKITEKHMEQYMLLCGEKDNPFPYYKYADLVAVLSYYEGLCGVVNEAKIMQRPLIATEFSGIHEQIANGKNGIIVENNTDAIIAGISKLIENKQLTNSMAVNEMPEELTDNQMKIHKYEQLFNMIEKRKANV